MMHRVLLPALVTLMLAALLVSPDAAHAQLEAELRANADNARNAGNVKEALAIYEKLLEKPDSAAPASDLSSAIMCQIKLGMVDEIDPLIERALSRHKKNWRLLVCAAELYRDLIHTGYLEQGVFRRGYRRTVGRLVNSFRRDRVRSLQLMEQAKPLVVENGGPVDRAEFFLKLAQLLMSEDHNAWRLQHLTDISVLPDYDEQHYYHGPSLGAPVDTNGNPVYYSVPGSWESAASDGERWRWALAEARRQHPDVAGETEMRLAGFLRSQFDVSTLSGRVPLGDPAAGTQSELLTLHTLEDNETVAQLATGVKRFKLPAGFEFPAIYRRLGESSAQEAEAALDIYAEILTDRRRYPQAAEVLKAAIERFGRGAQEYRQRKLDQIVGAWGRFEAARAQPAGGKPQLQYRFRNGTSASFEAKEVDIDRLLADVKAHLSSDPSRLDWEKIQLEQIGWRLLGDHSAKYLGAVKAEWQERLTPKQQHFDAVTTVTVPLQTAGAYLITASIAGGNQSSVLLWVADTALVGKKLQDGHYYYVADARSGKPVANAEVELFGYRNDWRDGKHKITTLSKRARTNGSGEAVFSGQSMAGYQLLAIARPAKGGLAFDGFNAVWFSHGLSAPADGRARAYTITNQPVYRPGQEVQFHAWAARIAYESRGRSSFAGRSLAVQINDPMGQTAFESSFTADTFGGVHGSYKLAPNATLGTYQISIGLPDTILGTAAFRVEEYKKPELEVTVEAPSEPAALGDVLHAKITARYYFGAPVTNATVHYTVQRTASREVWFPPCPWDWLFGPGYWWFAPTYEWYPAFSRWGHPGSAPLSRFHHYQPPEVVQDATVDIAKDGTVEVRIDTQLAKELHGDTDHRYLITAEVIDASRRSVVGSGEVIAAKAPYKVNVWLDHGHYLPGQTATARFIARTPAGAPVQGDGELTLFKVKLDPNGTPREQPVERWQLATDDDGSASQQLVLAAAGQYRLSYRLKDAHGREVEGGYVFSVYGPDASAEDFRFNAIELIPDKREYAPGESINLAINANQPGATVLLFLRPEHGGYPRPEVLTLDGKSLLKTIPVAAADMPNFFIEALTIHNGEVHGTVRQIVVPPQKQVAQVELLPSGSRFKPGETAKIQLKLTDLDGKPFHGSTVLTAYDAALEYISGGANTPDIRKHFWDWKRAHSPSTTSSLGRISQALHRQGAVMLPLGVFGQQLAEEDRLDAPRRRAEGAPGEYLSMRDGATTLAAAAPAPFEAKFAGTEAEQQSPAAAVEPRLRKDFADAIFWQAGVTTDKDGMLEVNVPLPDNLTTWSIRAWAIGEGAKVGEARTEIVTAKDLLVRLQTPRFLVERDEVIISANIHNYLSTGKKVRARLAVSGGTLQLLDSEEQVLEVAPNDDKRVDWKLAAKAEGEAVLQVAALTDTESDAMELKMPVLVHGMEKTESFSGAMRLEDTSAAIELTIPEARRPEQSRVVLRYSPSIALALVDALPYLVSYPYGCTEQTLSRFLPTVLVQRLLGSMNVDLQAIAAKRSGLNPQQLGSPQERRKEWKRYEHNPVFDAAEVKKMSREGLERLLSMQNPDGGWGWFSGSGERSYGHTTAHVVHGLQTARAAGLNVPEAALDRGVRWLVQHEAEELRKIRNAATSTSPWKRNADNLDAYVHMVLADAGAADHAMSRELYNGRVELSLYGKALLGLALHRLQQREEAAMVLRNIEQFLVEDASNQTAYLRLENAGYWWYWYGSEIETLSYYLKLLVRMAPERETASRVVKYLLNNRGRGTYWSSTRDTALAVEAVAEYLKAAKEDALDLSLELLFDGVRKKAVKITSANLFDYDDSLVLSAEELKSGRHTLEIRKSGKGRLYYNAYVTNFTLEDMITEAGLELQAARAYYRVLPEAADTLVPGARGQAVQQKTRKDRRILIEPGTMLESGDLVEVELTIDSKNDYEYIMVEDPKAAGMEATAVQSGYDPSGAYVEYRDERVALFLRQLSRGRHTLFYRLRAETPGAFSALPTRVSGMYAPELRGNSNEHKLRIIDAPAAE